MLPKITELEFNTSNLSEDLPPIGKSFLYDFVNGEFVLKDGQLIELSALESLKIWILKVINTERFKFKIYEDVTYGITLNDLIGSNHPRAFIEAEIKREVTTALLRHPHIQLIEGWNFVRESNWMRIKFTVNTVETAFEQEVIM